MNKLIFFKIECADKCGACSPDINTCTSCYDGTRDESRNCECNYGKFTISTDASYPSCNQDCEFANCKVCAIDTGTCSECYDSINTNIGN